MNLTPKDLEKLTNERIKFYADISKNENDANFYKIEVLEHEALPESFLIHVKYDLVLENEIGKYNQIEMFTRDAGWIAISNSMTNRQMEGFLKDCTKTKFDVSEVILKK